MLTELTERRFARRHILASQFTNQEGIPKSYPATIRHKMRARYPVGKGDPFGGRGVDIAISVLPNLEGKLRKIQRPLKTLFARLSTTWKSSADMDVQPTWMYLS
jgi:hypothetical protein